MHDLKELNDIIRIIVEYYNKNKPKCERVTFEAIFGKSRDRDLTEIRFLFMYFARELYNKRLFSDKFISNYINLSRTMLSHAKKRVHELIEYDKFFKQIYFDLKEKINL